MSLGTIDRTPPPFFRQGPSALTKLVFFAALALFLMVADSRFEFARPLRAVIATALLPVQRTLNVPVELWHGGADYLRGLDSALAGQKAAQLQAVALSEKSASAARLAEDNQRLRALLDMRATLQVRSHAADVLYEGADPFSRKLFIDRGETQGVVLGSPVITPLGVLGQVTRVFPLSSQVTLITDKDFAIPVLNARTGVRGAAFGGAGGNALELRFLTPNADVREGDKLLTGGVDGVYPAKLAVATVFQVERRGESGFARVLLTPSARVEGVRHVLVLDPVGLHEPKPEQAVSAASQPAKATPAAKSPATKADAPSKAHTPKATAPAKTQRPVKGAKP